MSNKETYSHMDYRNTKIIRLIKKDVGERFIYKNKDISKEEADRLVKQYKEEKKLRNVRKEGSQ